MKNFNSLSYTSEDIENLKTWVTSGSGVIPFFNDAKHASFVVSYAMSLEIGGPNDNLAAHLFETDTGQKIKKTNLLSEIVEKDGFAGIRITTKDNSKISIRHDGLVKLGLVDEISISFFPEQIAELLRVQQIEPVFVRDWLLTCTFSDFNPTTTDYRVQMSELINNDAFLFAELVSNKQMVFQSLHDVIQHATNASAEGWIFAQNVAKKVKTIFSNYFGNEKKGNLPSHILPFVTGVLLDDLTQSSFYCSKEREFVIDSLLTQISKFYIRPQKPHILKKIPLAIEAVLRTARAFDIGTNENIINQEVSLLVEEVYSVTT
ncbi:MAG: hypothetical protein H7235_09520 [Bdellovibrionaceae bacterium]|nr:hypothetical protein [Pseudobdellovibrionaceae bacterium]